MSGPITLTPEAFGEAFPFHIAIDASLRLVQVGVTLTKIDPRLAAGLDFAERFAMRRPAVDIRFDTLAGLAGTLVLIEDRATGLLLRGQFVRPQADGPVLFLGSPWIVDPQQLGAYGLKISDFPIHDPLMDLLQVVQVHRATVNDVKQLAARLSAQRGELERKNEELASHYLATHRAERRLALQYAVVRSLTESDSVPEAIAAILRNVGETLGWHVGLAWMHDRQRGELRLEATWAVSELADDPIVTRAPLTRAFGQGPSGAVWQSGEPLFIRDARDDPRYPRGDDARGAEIRSCMWLPVQADRATLGVIALFSRELMEDDPGLSAAMETISRSFTQFVERKRQEDQLAALTGTLNAILALAPDALVAFDAKGDRTYANTAFFELTDLDPADQPAALPEFDAMLAGLCDPSVPYLPVSGMVANHADTLELVKPRRVVLARSVRRMGSGRSSGCVVYLRDITHDREVDRMKSEFLSTAAHELRTPMTGIHGYTELLLTRHFPEPVRMDILDTMYRQSTQLVNMINELLDLARIEARAGHDLKIRRQAIVPIVRGVVEALHVPNDTRRVELKLPEVSPLADVDADKFGQALTNVLSNAYKYSAGKGAIRLWMSARNVGARFETGVHIADEGIGMTPEQVARVFERFYRADTSGTIPGTGLGMSLVREYIELMQGSVQVASRHGEGTVVTIWVPRADP